MQDASRVATQATVRYAMAQDYVTEDQVRESLLVRNALREAGKPCQLLSILGARFIDPERLPELTAVYRQALDRAEAAGAAPPSEPEPPDGSISTVVSVPAELLKRTTDQLERAPVEDPEGVKRFFRESEKADVPLPTIKDRVFVSLAKKAGYPPREDLARCRELQLAARRKGENITLFEIVRKQRLLDERRVNRFLRWSAMIERKSHEPLEDEEVDERKAKSDLRRRVLVPSAASFQATVERCASCMSDLDDIAVMEGRARVTDRGLVCVPCRDGDAPRQPMANLVQAPPKAPKRRRRRGRALATSAAFVARRLGTDLERTEQRLLQIIAVTAGLGLVVGLAAGAIHMGSSTPVEVVDDDEPAGPAPPSVEVSASNPKADRAWAALRLQAPEDAVDGLELFARRFPDDPRARDATRFASLIEQAETAGAEAVTGDSPASLLLKEAARLQHRHPGEAMRLLRRVQQLDGAGEAGKTAEDRIRTLRVAALERVTVLRSKAAALVAAGRHTEALEMVLESATSPWDGLDGGGYDSLVNQLMRSVKAAAQVSGGKVPATWPPKIGRRPPRKATPKPLPVPKPTPGLGAGRTALYKLYRAYNEQDRAAVAALARTVEKELGADAPETKTARGLQDFLKGDYPSAVRLLEAAGSVAGGYGRIAIAQSYLYRHEYEKALAALSEEDLEGWYGKRIKQVIDGPFRATAPKAAAALESLTPDGRYRVVTDLGLKRGYVAGLERKLGRLGPAARAKLVDKERKRHAGLREVCAVMDKAYVAFDKLFAVDRRSQVVPTVFVFSERSGFDAFSRTIGSGTGESTLGYYWSPFRILCFYNMKGGSLGRLLSQETLEVLLHETFHQWLNNYVDGAPHWFNEGLAEYFGIAEMTKKEYRYGLVPKTPNSRLDNIRAALRGDMTSPLPLEGMIVATREVFMAPDAAATNYAAAWSFVHFLADSKGGQKLLRSYYRALLKRRTIEEAYEDVFGRGDVLALERNWIAYVGKLKKN